MTADYFMASGKKYSLLSYDKQPPPFIVFDLYNKELNTLRGCFVIKKTRNYLKIVRARHCRAEAKSATSGCRTSPSRGATRCSCTATARSS